MIVSTCECGLTYRSDEKHIGRSIRCVNDECRRIIPIARKSERSTLASRLEPAIEIIPPKRSHWSVSRSFIPKKIFLRNRLVPTLRILALLVGLTLTVVNLRARKTETPQSRSLAVPDSSPPNNTSNVSVANPAVRPSPTTSPDPQTIAANGSQNAPSQQASPSPVDISAGYREQPTSPYDAIIDVVNTPSPAAAPSTVRYASGTNLIPPQDENGRGVLTISNGTGSDAIVKLVDSETNKTRRMIYIQAYSEAKINSIGVGDYILKFAFGTGYDSSQDTFLHAQSFSRFDDILEFREYKTVEGLRRRVRWTTFEVTLHSVIDGNARTSPISAADFADH